MKSTDEAFRDCSLKWIFVGARDDRVFYSVLKVISRVLSHSHGQRCEEFSTC